jgi:type II secretory pathway predicted ATPase ExeA
MADSIQTHFSFSAAPFTKEVPDTDLWLPPSRQTAIDDLVECLDARCSALVTGESGVGKTCILRAVRQRLPKERFRLTYCHNATLGRRDFYRQTCTALGLSPKATAAAVFHAISAEVHQLATARVHPVLLIDEAHLLHPDVLGHLHILLNYEWDSRALLSVVLVGLPELDDRLATSVHKSLLSRLHTRLRIAPANEADSADYLRHRLGLAGCTKELFTAPAVSLLHEHSAGAHRDLDRLASLALREAVRRKKKLVEPDLVSAVLDAEARAA